MVSLIRLWRTGPSALNCWKFYWGSSGMGGKTDLRDGGFYFSSTISETPMHFCLLVCRECRNYWTCKVCRACWSDKFRSLTFRFCFFCYCRWHCGSSRFYCVEKEGVLLSPLPYHSADRLASIKVKTKQIVREIIFCELRIACISSRKRHN